MANNPFYEITAAYPEIHKYFGILAGFAFSISYSISGIIMGIISSKVNRKNLFFSMFTVSCLTSICTGYFDSFAVLVIMRFIQGVSMSAVDPCAYSIIQDYFPKRLRATANSIVVSSTYLGSGLVSMYIILI